MYQAITHGHGSIHDTIEDSATLLNKLNSIGVSYYFHGHVHEANVTIPTDGLVEIGCGSLSGDTSFLTSFFHQFAVGYIQDGQIAQVERWVDNSDGHGGFAVEQLYPKPKVFTDPDDIGKKEYPAVVPYIPRWVSSYEDANQSYFMRILAKEKQICLKEAVQKDKKILLLCDAGMGKSTELKNLAHVMSKQYHTFYYSLEQYTGQNIEELIPTAYKNLPPNRLALLFDGYDELDVEFEKTFKKKLNQYAQDAVGVNIVISSRSNFCGNESDI